MINRFMILSIVLSLLFVFVYQRRLHNIRKAQEDLRRFEDKQRMLYENSVEGMVERLDNIWQKTQQFESTHDNKLLDVDLDEIQRLQNSIAEKSILTHFGDSKRSNPVLKAQSNHGDVERTRLQNEQLL